MNKRRRFKAKRTRRARLLRDQFNYPWRHGRETVMAVTRWKAKQALLAMGEWPTNY